MPKRALNFVTNTVYVAVEVSQVIPVMEREFSMAGTVSGRTRHLTDPGQDRSSPDGWGQ
jgi:hypothetical protein